MIQTTQQEMVVLVHGLASHRFAMCPLAWSLRQLGFRVVNWGYRSMLGSIETHAQTFRQQLQRITANHRSGCLHIVTHSMGSIVARRALRDSPPETLGRIVMLGPPNSGSHVARRFSKSLGWVCRTQRELSDDPNSYVNRLGEPEGLEIGIIAAKRDRVVELSSTSLRCQCDHIVLPGHHGVLPWKANTANQVAHFLRNGKFLRELPYDNG